VSKLKDDRVFKAWRAAIRSHLLSVRAMEAQEADLWCDAWEAEADRQGLARNGDYWDAGKLWIDTQCVARKRPPN
jgi:hypothetical protein